MSNDCKIRISSLRYFFFQHVALLTIYDMCKALDKTMEIGEICLVKKTGGKSGNVYNDRHGGRDRRTGKESGRREIELM